jgi:multiple sugar transport system ATP-binding protein
VASVSFDRVTKVFSDGTCAVDELDLEVRDGEFLVLVGPSGCGKTTSLRMVAGLEDITAGEIRIGDRMVNDLDARERDIAMVFQNYALYPHMNTHENMAFGLKVRRQFPRREIRERVERIGRMLGLRELMARRPSQLSGGQRQRVAMGRAIVRSPEVFLMDEPLSNLDAKLRVQMRAQISRIQRDLGTTTIYVTHDQVEAMTMGDRIAVMRDGVLQQVGTPQDLYVHPQNMFVAGFIGSPAMNFVPGGVISGAGGSGQVVGFRPEHIRIGEAGSDGVGLAARVGVVEYLGDEQLAHFSVQDHTLLAKLPVEQRITADENLALTIPRDKLVLFDAETGDALGRW